MRRLSITIALLAVSCADTGDSRCTSNGECLPGFVCTDAFCVPGGGTGEVRGNCGPDGCTIDGPDGTKVTIPAGALSRFVTVVLDRGSDSVLVRRVVRRWGVYRFQITEGVDLEAPAIITVPLQGEEPTHTDAPTVWVAESAAGPWERLAGSVGTDEVTDTTARLGLFFAGHRKLPVDAGFVDSGPEPDPPDVFQIDQGFVRDADPVDLGRWPDADPPDRGPEGPPDSGAGGEPEAGPVDAGINSEADAGRPDSGAMQGMDAELPPDSGEGEPDGANVPDSGSDEGADVEPPDTGEQPVDGAVMPDSGGDDDTGVVAPDAGADEDAGSGIDSGTGGADAAPDAGSTEVDSGS